MKKLLYILVTLLLMSSCNKDNGSIDYMASISNVEKGIQGEWKVSYPDYTEGERVYIKVKGSDNGGIYSHNFFSGSSVLTERYYGSYTITKADGDYYINHTYSMRSEGHTIYRAESVKVESLRAKELQLENEPIFRK
jgi:hypothetical protein